MSTSDIVYKGLLSFDVACYSMFLACHYIHKGLQSQSSGTSGTDQGLLLHYFGDGPLAARGLTEFIQWRKRNFNIMPSLPQISIRQNNLQ